MSTKIFIGTDSAYNTVYIRTSAAYEDKPNRGQMDLKDASSINWFTPHGTQIKHIVIEEDFEIVNCDALWSTCTALEDIVGMEHIKGQPTNLSSMFNGCVKLTHIDLTGLDTSRCTNMSYMFTSCPNLEEIKVSEKFVTTTVTNSINMFTGDVMLPNFDSTKTDKTMAFDKHEGGYLTVADYDKYQHIQTRISNKYDTAANWASNNPKPYAGEICFESDTLQFKVGDGVHHYNLLPYYMPKVMVDIETVGLAQWKVTYSDGSTKIIG